MSAVGVTVAQTFLPHPSFAQSVRIPDRDLPDVADDLPYVRPGAAREADGTSVGSV